MASHEVVEETEDHEIPATGMRVETWIFLFLVIFFIGATLLYGFVVDWKEAVGITALALTALLALLIGTFLNFSSRRLEHARPEDDDHAEVSDGAGELGFFAASSYWPFGVAFAAASTAIAVAFWQTWLIAICVVFLLMAICGLTYEFHRRARTH